MDLGVYLLIFFSQIIANIVKAICGFGGPPIANSLMSLRLNNSTITPVSSLLDIPINAYLSWKERRYFSIKKILPYIFLLTIGTIPGAFILKTSPPWILKAAIGLFVVGLALNMLFNKSSSSKEKPWPVKLLIFALSGFAGGLFGINVLFIPKYEKMAASKNEFRGNICFTYLIDTSIRTIAYVILGMFTLQMMPVLVASAAGAVIGILVGNLLDQKVDNQLARYLSIATMIVAGLLVFTKTMISVLAA